MTGRSDGHVPERTCIGCRVRRPQHELRRCALVDGEAIESRTAPGRGAWLCGPECFALARRRGGFERAWRCPVASDVLDRLAERLAGDGTTRTGGDRPCRLRD